MSSKTDMDATLERGLAAFAEARHAEAYDAVAQVVEANPGDPRLWDLLGTIALEGDRPWHAYRAFTARRALQDDVDALLSQLAAAYYAIDIAKSRELSAEASARFPEHPEVRMWAGTIGSIDDTRAMLVHVGRTLCRQRRYADSIALFVAALEMADGPDARLWLGRAFLAMGKAADAVPLLEAAAAGISGDPSVFVDIARAYEMGGRVDIARAWLLSAANVHPEAAELREALARLALQAGDTATASSQSEAAVRLASESAGAWLVAAGAREATGDVERARLAIDRSLALDASSAHAWALGARVVQAAGDTGLASHYRGMAAHLAGTQPAETQPPGPLPAEVEQLYGIVTRDPAQVRAYRDRATVAGIIDLPERALYYLDLVIRDIAGGATPDLLVERAGLLVRTGDAAGAHAAVDEALRLDPSSGRAAAAKAALPGAETSRFCIQCGAEYSQGDAFCAECGNRRS